MSEKANEKAGLNRESTLQTDNIPEEQFGEVNVKNNPVAKAQQQISSQRTVGVISAQELDGENS